MRYPVAQPIPESIRITGDLILAKDTVHQREQHAGTSGFADGGGDSRNGIVRVPGDIHPSMLDEVWSSGKR
jgi:hypothetical protein